EQSAAEPGRAKATVPRPGVALAVVLLRLLACDALLFRGRIGLRRGNRLGLRLSSKHGLRRHVGCRGWCGDEDLCRIGMPGLWQALAVAGDHWRRTFLERCVRNEKQCDQHRTNYCKIPENWHRTRPDYARSSGTGCVAG